MTLTHLLAATGLLLAIALVVLTLRPLPGRGAADWVVSYALAATGLFVCGAAAFFGGGAARTPPGAAAFASLALTAGFVMAVMAVAGSLGLLTNRPPAIEKDSEEDLARRAAALEHTLQYPH